MKGSLSGGEAKQLSDKVIEFGRDVSRRPADCRSGFAGWRRQFPDDDPNSSGAGRIAGKEFSARGSDVQHFPVLGRRAALYYPATAKGVSNIVMQPVGSATITQMTNFDDLLIYGYSYDWKNKRVAVARGRSNTDVVLLTQQQVQP